MDVFDWIQQELHPESCTSDRFVYDDMESQSGRALPVIYQPFDASQRLHWWDRGSLFDYLYSTHGEGKKLLDFGPGDGWPSLIVAPFAAQVVGVDGSPRRVEVCTENARRLGIENAVFLHTPPGQRLPFDDHSFEGVMAASSVEQTPDPKDTLRELYRVLRPGGRLRIYYEALGRYRNGEERDSWLFGMNDRVSRLILYDRHIEEETVWQVGLTFSLSETEVLEHLSQDGRSLPFHDIRVDGLQSLLPHLLDARGLTTRHPSGKTFVSWLKEIGFRQALPTHRGDWFAGRVFDQLPADRRPATMDGVDELLRPLVKIAVEMLAPVEFDPMIMALK